MTFDEKIEALKQVASRTLDRLRLIHISKDHRKSCLELESIADRVWGKGKRPADWGFDAQSPQPSKDSPVTDQVVRKYVRACEMADSVREIEGQSCQVVDGANGGYFIEVYGKSFRFASVTNPNVIAQLFVDMVAAGPDVRIP